MSVDETTKNILKSYIERIENLEGPKHILNVLVLLTFILF